MVNPEKRFKAGACIASVFAKEIGRANDTVVFHNVTLQRVYKGADGQFQYATSFHVGDLPKAIFVLGRAYAYLLNDSREESG